MTPKTLRDLATTALTSGSPLTDAGTNVYSGRFLPHIINDLNQTGDEFKFVDINVYNREITNEYARTVGLIKTYELNIDCICAVKETVMDEIDNLIEQVKDKLFTQGGLLGDDCLYTDEIINIGTITETIVTNTDLSREFTIGTVVIEVQTT